VSSVAPVSQFFGAATRTRGTGLGPLAAGPRRLCLGEICPTFYYFASHRATTATRCLTDRTRPRRGEPILGMFQRIASNCRQLHPQYSGKRPSISSHAMQQRSAKSRKTKRKHVWMRRGPARLGMMTGKSERGVQRKRGRTTTRWKAVHVPLTNRAINISRFVTSISTINLTTPMRRGLALRKMRMRSKLRSARCRGSVPSVHGLHHASR
jgi:hypothetical protein